MPDSPRFITDATLGKLAKWLRLLGYDTKVFPKEAGREMLRLAQAEGRIVLTRRKDMGERQFSGVLHIVESQELVSQIRDVAGKFSLRNEKEKMFSICLKCNQPLSPATVSDVRERVPAYVFEHCSSFNRCPSCERIFWEGTHRRNSLQFLRKHGII